MECSLIYYMFCSLRGHQVYSWVYLSIQKGVKWVIWSEKIIKFLKNTSKIVLGFQHHTTICHFTLHIFDDPERPRFRFHLIIPIKCDTCCLKIPFVRSNLNGPSHFNSQRCTQTSTQSLYHHFHPIYSTDNESMFDFNF